MKLHSRIALPAVVLVAALGFASPVSAGDEGWCRAQHPCGPPPPCHRYCPSPTPSVTPSATPTATPSVTPSATPTASPTPSATPTPTATPAPTETPQPTPTATGAGQPEPTLPATPPVRVISTKDELPVTGAPVGPLVVVGVVAIAAGVAALLARRRRTSKA